MLLITFITKQFVKMSDIYLIRFALHMMLQLTLLKFWLVKKCFFFKNFIFSSYTMLTNKTSVSTVKLPYPLKKMSIIWQKAPECGPDKIF